MRTANPVLNDTVFNAPSGTWNTSAASDVMSVQGVVNRTGFLLVVVLLGAYYPWRLVLVHDNPQAAMPWIWGGLIAGLILALVTIFKKSLAPYTSPFYAFAQGALLGGISAMMEMQMPGIVIQAVALTFGVTAAMLLAYTSRLIQATEKFRFGVVAATGGIMIVYLASFVLGMFGVAVPYIHEGGVIGIGFSLFVCVIAALNLVLDFDFIERGAQQGAPKAMEWFAAFGLLVTLVWLYIEILRLLSKLRR